MMLTPAVKSKSMEVPISGSPELPDSPELNKEDKVKRIASDSDSSEGFDMTINHFKSNNLDDQKEVIEAIESCKRAILETTASTDSRKDMVQTLIKLRIRLHDLQIREAAPVQAFETQGHVFVSYDKSSNIPGMANSRKIYCQQCASNIWVYLQSSQHCRECGFSVHATCMDKIMRGCVAIKVKTQPDFILDICPEKSMPRIKYRCMECDGKLSWNNLSRRPRLCDYTGLWFCPTCHWNDTAITPARVVMDWDFEPRPVSQASKQYLFLMQNKPVLKVHEINSCLHAAIPELGVVQQLRNTIIVMKKYLTVCRLAGEQRLLLLLANRQHFVDDADHYSMTDLLEVNSGVLQPALEAVIEKFASHIKNCILCTAKSYHCELCDSDEKLFPFDDMSASCEKCNTVFHRDCFPTNTKCPKCKRISSRS
ncbi:differentially expressed in FDCP 8-like [Tigriopus californicus]|uniref:differentially expressed in FDCP 8-like n=1 Tax=Tigriopus californicus TaxID=6832 RepID=UPI0027DA0998|nr:differentially expressed in FDCP 8-like [Tigriopus californicus]XP_059082879.1 differentially expressed in FDCP 8-like [Tigriopus californicus]XP_059082880.1 differentially expressed in FDCP 8-like [Tigriopus californicus]XP_059082881.1 differentially expressed in FDCP 8-like [Tigriopus californicus]